MKSAQSLAEIAAKLQGYDPQALDVEGVLKFLSELVTPIEVIEEIDIIQSLQRVVAADVFCPIHVPPHDNSAMDGYAFNGAQLDSRDSLTLKVIGTALAGKALARTSSSAKKTYFLFACNLGALCQGHQCEGGTHIGKVMFIITVKRPRKPSATFSLV